MKILLLLLSFAFMSCGGNTSNTTAQDTTPTQAQPKTTAQNNTHKTSTQASASGDYPSQAAIDATNKPVYGGAADIVLKVKGAKAGRADLIGFYAEENVRVDTVSRSADGTARFNKPGGYPQGIYYISYAKDKYLQVLLGEDQEFSMETSIENPDGLMKVTGSDENEAFFTNIRFEKSNAPKFEATAAKMKGVKEGSPEYAKLKAAQETYNDERLAHLEELYKKYPNTLFTKFKQAGANPVLRTDVPENTVVYHYRQDFWEGVDFSDRRLLRTPVIHNKLKRYFKELTPQNQDSIFASATRLCDRVLVYPEYYMFFTNWIVRQFEPTKTSLMDPEFVHVRMIQKYFNKDRAFWADSLQLFALHQRAGEMAQSLLGDQGPDIISKDLQGKTHRLMDSKADYLIVYMFAPSCEHCQEQTPKLVTWYNEWKNKGADVYAIALDSNQEDPNELANYIKKTNMPFPCVWDPTNRSIYAKYYVDITPEIYVLNPERKIIGKNLKVFQIETIINRDKENR